MLVPFRDHPGADFLRPPTPRRHSLVEEVSAAPYVPPFRSSELPVLEKNPAAFFGGRNLMEPKKNVVTQKVAQIFEMLPPLPWLEAMKLWRWYRWFFPPPKRRSMFPFYCRKGWRTHFGQKKMGGNECPRTPGKQKNRVKPSVVWNRRRKNHALNQGEAIPFIVNKRPGKFTWKHMEAKAMEAWKMTFHFNWGFFGWFHLSFRGCTMGGNRWRFFSFKKKTSQYGSIGCRKLRVNFNESFAAWSLFGVRQND